MTYMKLAMLTCIMSTSAVSFAASQSQAAQMINPPLIPMDTTSFKAGLIQGAIPFLGFAVLFEPNNSSFTDYYTFKHDARATAEKLLWNKNEKEALIQKYVQIRESLASGSHLDTSRLCEEFNSINKNFDIRDAHNYAYRRSAQAVSERLGILTGCTISTCAFIYFISNLLEMDRHLPPRPIYTRVCTSPTINDLD